MTIFEYVKEPHPWFNTVDYEPWQIAMFITGTLLWLVSYADIIVHIRSKKALIIPYAGYGYGTGSWLLVMDDF
jgi:hypothetical protein